MAIIRGDWIDRSLDILVTSGLAAMVLMIIANVFSRKVLNMSLVWTTEVSLTIFIWIAFLGSVKLARHNQHLRVKFLLAKLSPRGLLCGETVVDGLVFLYCVLAVLTAWPILRSASLMRLSAVPWNADVFYWALPVGFSGIAFVMVLRIVARLRGRHVDATDELMVD